MFIHSIYEVLRMCESCPYERTIITFLCLHDVTMFVNIANVSTNYNSLIISRN